MSEPEDKPGSTVNQPIRDHWQVVVIGAGVAGGLAALNCAKAGWSTLLVERQSFPRDKVCGCCLNSKAVGILKRARLPGNLFDNEVSRIQLTKFHVKGRAATVRLPETQAVSRSRLDSALVAAMIDAGGTFLDSTTAIVAPSDFEARPVTAGHESSQDYEAVRSISLTTTSSPTGSALTSAPTPARARTITAEIVLVCDGLGHGSLKMFPSVKSDVSSTARIGLGAVVDLSDQDTAYPLHELQMAVSPAGYVGTVPLEGCLLNLAAAVDGHLLKQAGSPQRALRQIYESAGLPAPAHLDAAHVRGTLPLTRSSSVMSLPRIFVLGDAAGYVEPFTGEGMTWAATAAQIVVPLVTNAIKHGWSAQLQIQWQQQASQHVKRRQRICRMLAGSLRIPWLLTPMLNACRIFPSVADTIVSRLNHTTFVQERS